MDGGIEERVKQCVAETLLVMDVEVGSDDTLVQDLGADEIDMLDLAAALNRELGIDITPEQMENVCTVRDLLVLVRSKHPFD